MSRSRLALAVLVVAVVSAAPASAAKPKPKPKPVCNLVVDEVGTAGMFAAVAGAATYDPSLDIVSADVASDAKTLTAVIRVKDLTEKAAAAPTGRMWGISFQNGTQSVGMNAYLSETFGQHFSTGKGSLDFANNEIRIHVALADIGYAGIKKGSLLRGFYVISNATIAFDPAWGLGSGFAPTGGSTDDATAPKAAYASGALSCVKPGK